MTDQSTMLYNCLKSAKRSDEIINVFSKYHKVNDTNCQNYIFSHNINIACRQGCAYCCNIPVEARPYEIFLINTYMKKHFSTKKLTKTMDTLNNHVQFLSKITKNEHLSINSPCPLLAENSCMVYPVRPFACRAYHALDVSSCQYSFENPSDLEERRATDHDLDSQWEGVRTSVAAIFQKLGYDTTHNELGTALLHSLQDSKVQRRWVNKKTAFVQMHTYQDD
ncbi:MAG: YkgJ family cysteine cluster protein [Deltaproteobacteria bacterium]|nr:YkgJ family cysteine cluster protein [Deltaproteobacteria bacterium]